jgi:hypothetical protein
LYLLIRGLLIPWLEIENQTRGLGSRHANLHHLVFSTFAFAQYVVAVIGDAFQDGYLADSTLAALTIVHRIDCFLYQHLQNALVRWNDEGQAGASISLSSAIAVSAFNLSRQRRSLQNQASRLRHCR